MEKKNELEKISKRLEILKDKELITTAEYEEQKQRLRMKKKLIIVEDNIEWENYEKIKENISGYFAKALENDGTIIEVPGELTMAEYEEVGDTWTRVINKDDTSYLTYIREHEPLSKIKAFGVEWKILLEGDTWMVLSN